MRSQLTRAATVAVAAVGACALALPMTGTALAGPAPHRATGRAVLSGTSPQWTRTARVAGAPRAGQRIAFHVALRLRHLAAAERLPREVSRPASPRYGHYLTARRFNRAYGPARTGSPARA